MEPPGEGRYEEGAIWALGPVGLDAAMEPPGEGRYEPEAGERVGQDATAAMEPPGEGRYELLCSAQFSANCYQPQWSRPVKGGTRPVSGS